MSIEWVRKTYRVPAKRGGRIEYTGEKEPQLGTICGASGGHLSIRLDGCKHTMPFHPTWEIRYLAAEYMAEITKPLPQSVKNNS
jgi:hypothetical protein